MGVDHQQAGAHLGHRLQNREHLRRVQVVEQSEEIDDVELAQRASSHRAHVLLPE